MRDNKLLANLVYEKLSYAFALMLYKSILHHKIEHSLPAWSQKVNLLLGNFIFK